MSPPAPQYYFVFLPRLQINQVFSSEGQKMLTEEKKTNTINLQRNLSISNICSISLL